MNLAIDGEPVAGHWHSSAQLERRAGGGRSPGAAVAAGVAAVAVVALQQRAIAPGRAAPAGSREAVTARGIARSRRPPHQTPPREALSYTVPATLARRSRGDGAGAA